WKVLGTTGQTLKTGTGSSIDFIPTESGSYTVQVTATDKDSATTTTTKTLTVSAEALLTDPADSSKTALYAGGTTGSDSITLRPVDATGTIQVTINGVVQGSYSPTGHIIVYGQAGNDNIQLSSRIINGVTVKIAVPAVLFGDDGNDTLNASGSSANNILVG